MSWGFRHRFLSCALQGCLGVIGLTFVGCAAREPEDPGYNKPAVSGVVSGEIHSVDDYLNAVEKENERRLRTEGDVWGNPEDF